MSHDSHVTITWSTRDRPAAIPVHVKHMADTSNFDDFDELDQKKRTFISFLLCGALFFFLYHRILLSWIVWSLFNEWQLCANVKFNNIVWCLMCTNLNQIFHPLPRLFTFFLSPSPAFHEESEGDSKDWVFQNFTFKRFEGLTQRGHFKLWWDTISLSVCCLTFVVCGCDSSVMHPSVTPKSSRIYYICALSDWNIGFL